MSCPPPRKGGRGTIRSERKRAEDGGGGAGADDISFHDVEQQVRRSSPQRMSLNENEAARPAPPPPRFARSPSPRYRGGGKAISFSRRVFAPELCQATARKPPQTNKGGRSADRRLRKEPRHTSKRYRLPMLRARRAPRICDVAAENALRARSPLGAPSRLSSRGFRLRAIRSRPRVTRTGGAGVTRSSFAPKPSTWHPDRSVEGVDTRTARERGDKPRPQEPQPAPSIGSQPVDTPDERDGPF
jgi:hypothetical protein